MGGTIIHTHPVGYNEPGHADPTMPVPTNATPETKAAMQRAYQEYQRRKRASDDFHRQQKLLKSYSRVSNLSRANIQTAKLREVQKWLELASSARHLLPQNRHAHCDWIINALKQRLANNQNGHHKNVVSQSERFIDIPKPQQSQRIASSPESTSAWNDAIRALKQKYDR